MAKVKGKPSLLTEATRILGLVDGCLLPATSAPTDTSASEWMDKGDWLVLANDVGAREVFFVDNEPVVVLAELPNDADEKQFFNRVWSMARPQMLFLASEGELAVYQLAASPVKGEELLKSDDRLLAMATSVEEIQTKLANFTRQSIETGRVYGDDKFGGGAERADRALVHDLKAVRKQLINLEPKLAPNIVHSLIGRALFIRYLEDRQILVREYFEAVARKNSTWEQLLARKPTEVFAEPRFADVLFFRVLQDKDFTYGLFERLARDFNGDTFPVTDEEFNKVQPAHLQLLRSLLMGNDVEERGQRRLFLFAYKFEIIPIELISSIYESFYTAERGKDNTQSSYYTPPALVDFLLSRTLTRELLDERPRVIDPACGSGIFLVETFRRMVRHRIGKHRRRLSQRELRVILRDQIRGIDLNPEAVPIAAFSLYLAYLHYQNPREIHESRKLPNLRWKSRLSTERDPEQHFDILFAGSAFEAIQHEDAVVLRHFGPMSADVVVGNPPWGTVAPGDTRGQHALPRMEAWCDSDAERVIGDKELSQAFVLLALELLSDKGIAAMLLSSGVLFKQHDNSRRFRNSWLRRCKLKHVVNFAHVRQIYFADSAKKQRGESSVRESDGIAPFISAIFEKGAPSRSHRFSYWAARRITEVEKTRAVVISRADMHLVNQEQCRRYDSLWKIYWWGGRRDEQLIRAIERFPNFANVLAALPGQIDGTEERHGRGFEERSHGNDAGWLADYKELPAKKFQRYGTITNADLREVPPTVGRHGAQHVYEGNRLLLSRGIGNDGIVARLETAKFCFRHSIRGFRLDGLQPWQQRVLLGIFWSRLAKYYFWLTSGSWGMWHHELSRQTAESIPIVFPNDIELRARIERCVKRLEQTSLEPAHARIRQMEDDLDEAIFDLYELNAADRDLVRDMCYWGLDFFYKGSHSHAVASTKLPALLHGLSQDLPHEPAEGLVGYLQVFLRQWNADLAPDGELAWEVIPGPGSASVLALAFSTVSNGERPKPSASGDRLAHWNQLLRNMATFNFVPAEAHRTIYTDTFIRAVSDHEMLIIKRNEARFWTRSAALEDADVTVAQAMNMAERQS